MNIFLFSLFFCSHFLSFSLGVKTESLEDKLKALINQAPVMLFMKVGGVGGVGGGGGVFCFFLYFFISLTSLITTNDNSN